MRPLSAIPLLLALGLTACSAATAPGSRYHLTAPQQLAGNTVQWLALCNPNPDVGPVTCNAILTGERTDEEAWHFEARLRVVSGLGISYGRSPTDFIVAGPQEHCERVRAAFRSKPHIFYAEETPPTEPCRGPLYFKQEAGK
jgi:hypothetical protein